MLGVLDSALKPGLRVHGVTYEANAFVLQKFALPNSVLGTALKCLDTAVRPNHAPPRNSLWRLRHPSPDQEAAHGMGQFASDFAVTANLTRRDRADNRPEFFEP